MPGDARVARERELLTLARAVASADPLVGLRALSRLRRHLDGFERHQIRRALMSGESFAAVARARGISRQAAHRQYRHLVDPLAAPQRSLRCDASARQVLRLARREAALIGADAVGGVDILLALVATGELPVALEVARAHAARRGPAGAPPTRVDPTVLEALLSSGATVDSEDLLRVALADPAARALLDRLAEPACQRAPGARFSGEGAG